MGARDCTLYVSRHQPPFLGYMYNVQTAGTLHIVYIAVFFCNKKGNLATPLRIEPAGCAHARIHRPCTQVNGDRGDVAFPQPPRPPRRKKLFPVQSLVDGKYGAGREYLNRGRNPKKYDTRTQVPYLSIHPNIFILPVPSSSISNWANQLTATNYCLVRSARQFYQWPHPP